MKILDATCGMKSIWYQKNHPFVTFMDVRKGNFMRKQTEGCKKINDRIHRVNPDIVSDWQNIPFEDNHFDMVIFDPPHLIVDRNKKPPAMANQYGFLYSDNWKQIISNGLKEIFRVLKPEGILIFKWCDTTKPISELLFLFPYQPLFGTRTGTSNHTHWIVFLKYNVNQKIGVE